MRARASGAARRSGTAPRIARPDGPAVDRGFGRGRGVHWAPAGGGEALDGVDPRRGRRRVHRVEPRPAPARPHGRAGRGPRSPHLCGQPGEPGRRAGAPPLLVRPGRHRGSRGRGGPPREAPPGCARQPGRRDPRRPLDRRPARVRRDEPGGDVRAPGRGAPAPRDARARAPGPLPVPARLHRRGVRLPWTHGAVRRGRARTPRTRRTPPRRRGPITWCGRITRPTASRRSSPTARTTTDPSSTRRS